jgi:hypothetical protein
VRELLKLGIAIGLVAFIGLVIAPMAERHNQEANLAGKAAQEAAERAYQEPFARAFASGDWQQILDHCRNATNDASSFFHPPQALAMAADRVDVYVYDGPSPTSLLRMSCSATGLSEARVDHPLRQLVAVEQGDRERSYGNLWGEMGMLLRTQPLPVASIEVLLRPDNDFVLRRTINRIDSGWQVQIEPPGSPNFSLLSTSASLLSSQAEPGELDSYLPAATLAYPRHQWSAASSEAFAFLERELPEELTAQIAGMRFDDDEISLVIAGPVPGFSFAYATIAYDAWGTASNWLYPYDEPPSFGCPSGTPLAEVRQRFDQACASLRGCSADSHFSIAFYSCAAEGEGQWQLHLQQ